MGDPGRSICQIQALPSAVFLDENAKTRRTADTQERGHSEGKAALVACLVLGYDRPGFGLALRIRVVLWEIHFLLPGCSSQDGCDCGVVRGRCVCPSSRVARSKVARCRGI